MSDTPRDCKHGNLARVCEICELQRELTAAQAERDTAQKLLRRNDELLAKYIREYEGAKAEIERLKAEAPQPCTDAKEESMGCYRAVKAEAEAQRYREAIINMRDVKGRYHTEIATKALFALVDNAARGNL